MNNKETDLRFKNKYLKYKHKYLVLKNQLGGYPAITDSKCTNQIYNIWDKKTSKCCNAAKSQECQYAVPTIDKIKGDDLTINMNKFEKTQYYGETKIKEHENIKVDIKDGKKPDMSFYKSFYTLKDTKKNIIGKYVNKNLIFTLDTLISSGTEGYIIRYHDIKNNKYICVKYGNERKKTCIDPTKTDKDCKKWKDKHFLNEISVIENMKNKSCLPFIVNYNINPENEIMCVIMENAVGTLKDLIHEIRENKSLLIDILYAVVIAIKCLYDNSYYYTDIKLENILYRYDVLGIQIILGDLGSISREGGKPVITFPPVEFTLAYLSSDYKYKDHYNIYTSVLDEKISIISWGIGILILDLLSINFDKIDIKTGLAVNPETVTKFITQFNNTSIHTLISGTLNPDHVKRFKLDAIIIELIRLLDNPTMIIHPIVANNSGSYNNTTIELSADIKTQYKLVTGVYTFESTGNYTGNYLVTLSKKIPYYKSFTYKYNGISKTFMYDKTISSEVYDTVMRYKSDTNTFIAVKYGNIEPDLNNIFAMKDSHDKCSELLVKYKVYHDRKNKFQCIIMENAIDTIDKLIVITKDAKNINILINIINAIVTAIKCLYDIKLYYTDIKIQNILYRNTTTGIQIILGDLGGITNSYSEIHGTYIPPRYLRVQDYRNTETGKHNDYTRIILWGIGILILQMCHSIFSSEELNLLCHKEIMKTFKPEDMEHLILTLKNKNLNRDIYNLVGNLLNPQYNDKGYLNLDKILSILEQYDLVQQQRSSRSNSVSQIPTEQYDLVQQLRSSRSNSVSQLPTEQLDTETVPPPDDTLTLQEQYDTVPLPPQPRPKYSIKNPPPPPIKRPPSSSPQHNTPSSRHNGDIVIKPSDRVMVNHDNKYNIIITLYFTKIITNLFSIVYTKLLDKCKTLYSPNLENINKYLNSNIDITELDNNLRTVMVKDKLTPICKVIQQIDYNKFKDYYSQYYINLKKQHNLNNLKSNYNFNDEDWSRITKNIDIIILNYINLQCNPSNPK